MANIFKQLSDEHDEIRKLIETLAQDEGDRMPVFDELRRTLLAHSKGEEEEFYSQIRSLDEEIASRVEDSLQEHQEIEKIFQRMVRSLSDDERFAVWLEELRDNVEQHTDTEESELFPLVEQHMSESELAELNDRYLAARQAAMEALEPTGDAYSHMTKDELYEEAKAADISGRSTMTREELEEQLRELEE